MERTTIQLTPQTLQRLRIRKAHNSCATYDDCISSMLDQPNKNQGQ